MLSSKTKAFMAGMFFVTMSVLAGCSTPTPTPQPQAGPRDSLLGWFHMTKRDHMIPVFRSNGTYYSVCRGFEIPLRECSAGLESAAPPTTIGFDETSHNYYIIIEDEELAQQYQDYIRGEKQPMTKIDKPLELFDAAAPPPASSDDFLGWYLPVWFPFPMWEIRKEGPTYLAVYHEPDPSGTWHTEGQPYELTPLPDRLGFIGLEKELNTYSLIYNEVLHRFEIENSEFPQIVRMPLVQFQTPPAAEDFTPVGRTMAKIGIPIWH